VRRPKISDLISFADCDLDGAIAICGRKSGRETGDRVAEQTGDPDELLSEDWIPEFEEDTGRVIYPPFEDVE
jgi:hypothetical protein